uniref:Ubiquitin-fold modifier-conjugating enzyme 1 n=1 Tax=Anas platyrhynchos TaxID=8839 RepID=A0A8B9ZFE5_ANAPL
RPLLEASLPPHRPQQRWRRRRVSAPSRGPGAASGRGGDGGGGGSAGSGGAAAATDGRRGRGTGSGGRRGLKEEYRALIQYVENNKNADNDWFRLESNAEGTRWFGRCWYIHELLKYEFAIEFDGGQDLPQRPLQAPVGPQRAQVRAGAPHGAGARPLAGRGDPRPRRQGPDPAQGEVRGALGGGSAPPGGADPPPEVLTPPTAPPPPLFSLLSPNKLCSPHPAPAAAALWGGQTNISGGSPQFLPPP